MEIRGIPVLEGVVVYGTDRRAEALRCEGGDISLSVSPCTVPGVLKTPFLRGPARILRDAAMTLRSLTCARGTREMVRPLDLGLFRISSPWLLAALSGLWILLLVPACMAVLPGLMYLVLTRSAMLSVNAAGGLTCLLRAMLLLPMARCISRARFLRRLSMYRSALGKAANCAERSMPRTMENVLTCSRLTGRSSAALALAAAFVSLLAFGFLPVDALPPLLNAGARLLVLLCAVSLLEEARLLLARFTGRPAAVAAAILMAFERLCCIEPHTEILQVAMRAVDAVYALSIPEAEREVLS